MAIVTIYTPAPALGADDANPNTNFRVLVKLASNSGGKLRARYRTSSTTGLNLVGAAFGKWNGVALGASSCDMTTPAFRLTFSGSNGVSIAAGGSATSDLITHTGLTLNAGDWVIVTFYCATPGGQRYSTGHTTATTSFKAQATDYSQAQTAAAMSGGLAIIGGAQPGGSGGYNFAVDLVESDAAGGGGSMKYWAGTAWASKPLKYWSGSAWVSKPVKYWTGSAWVVKP